MDPRTIIDAGLELTVVASFSRVGIVVRRGLFAWDAPPDGALRGRTSLVTGPTSGLGRATAESLAALGARVILAGRSRERLEEVRDALVAEHGEDRFPIVIADMGSRASVGAAAAHILATESRLDVLVDNAGAIFPERTEGPDGIEATLATLVVGPFRLIADLLPLLRSTGDARVISVTSGGMYTQPLDLDELQHLGGPGESWNGPRAYARAKRAQTALMREWARRFPDDGVSFSAMHPGWADTPGLAASLPGFHGVMGPLLRTPAEGIDTILWLATTPDAAAMSGRLLLDRRPRPFDRVPWTRVSAADRRRLWSRVSGLAEVTPGP